MTRLTDSYARVAGDVLIVNDDRVTVCLPVAQTYAVGSAYQIEAQARTVRVLDGSRVVASLCKGETVTFVARWPWWRQFLVLPAVWRRVKL